MARRDDTQHRDYLSVTPPEEQANAGAWLKEPEVIIGRMGRDFTFLTDGLTSRIIPKSRFGAQAHTRATSWPAVGQHQSPWLRSLPVTLGQGQTLLDDGFRMHVKERIPFVHPPAIEDDAIPAVHVCIPATVDDISPSVGATYNISDVIHLSPVGADGTTPLTYEWTVNGTTRSTSETFDYMVVDADITGKDGTGLGTLSVRLYVRNACNVVGTHVDAAYPAQGIPL